MIWWSEGYSVGFEIYEQTDCVYEWAFDRYRLPEFELDDLDGMMEQLWAKREGLA